MRTNSTSTRKIFESLSESVTYDNEEDIMKILGDTFEGAGYSSGIKRFRGVTADQLKQLLDKGYIDSQEKFNDSPTVGEIYQFINNHEGFTCWGYMEHPSRKGNIYLYAIDYDGPNADDFRDSFLDFVKNADNIVNDPETLYGWWD